MMFRKKILLSMVMLLSILFRAQKSSAQESLDYSNRTLFYPQRNPVKKATGPLHINPANTRYFFDKNEQPVFLIGSHTWSNFQDLKFEGDKDFDYDQYIRFMVANHYNYMRFWMWEHAAWAQWSPEKMIVDPMPYVRTGKELALDGKPKFDLTQFNQAFFDRMRARLIKARDNGIYASIQLFQAFSGRWPFYRGPQDNAFKGHYYNKDNNIQKFDGDRDKDSALDLNNPEVRKCEALYMKKIAETVSDLDNVMYEVINEGGNKDWDRFVIRTMQDYEKKLGKVHAIGIAGHGGEKLGDMLDGQADWISPGNNDGPGFEDPFNNPPLWLGFKKVSVLDTDHLWGHGIEYPWVWRAFTRGHNILFMDPWDPIPDWPDKDRNRPDYPDYQPARKAMKVAAECAARLDLLNAKPSMDIASSKFCLYVPGKQYLIYIPETLGTTVDLTDAPGTFKVEWIHPVEGTVIYGEDVEGGKKQTLWCPYHTNDVVLYLHKPDLK